MLVQGNQLRPERPEREVLIRPLRAGEVIEFGDYVELSPVPNFSAGQVVHGRKVLPSEAVVQKFWRDA